MQVFQQDQRGVDDRSEGKVLVKSVFFHRSNQTANNKERTCIGVAATEPNGMGPNLL